MADAGAVSKPINIPFLKRWTSDDDNILSDGPPADRRKPRIYASLKPGFANTAIPLDFCIWLESEQFGINRKLFLIASGAKWLGEQTW